MREWKEQIHQCGLVLVSIPKHMKNVVFDEGKDSYNCLQRSDPRVRPIPFMIGRPTFEETKRVHAVCSTLTLSKIKEEGTNDVATSADSMNRIQTVARSTDELKVKAAASATTRVDVSTKIPMKYEPPVETSLICAACKDGDGAELLRQLSHLSAVSSSSFSHILDVPETIQDLKTALHFAAEYG